MEMEYLSVEQRSFFDSEGYLVIEGFWNIDTIQRLRQRILRILSDLKPGDSSVESVFSTTEQTRKTADNYFLESGDKIRFFWEERAKKDGKLVQSPEECVNKIGHALHDLDEEFRAVSYDKRVGMICRDLGLKMPMAVQSMYIFKQPRIGGEVGAHQDGAFLYTEPQSVLGFWWPLDDCKTTNGCLWALPKSHLWYSLLPSLIFNNK